MQIKQDSALLIQLLGLVNNFMPIDPFFEGKNNDGNQTFF